MTPSDATFRSVLKSQYHAALAMLKEAVERCPDEVWASRAHVNAWWQVAYHTLYFTHLYLQPDEAAFRPWARQPRELMIETVGDEKFELRDGARVMEIYRIRNDTHNDGILMVYLPASRILIEADVYTPGRGGPTAENLFKEIQDRRLRVDRIAPIHGTVVPFAELQKTVAGAGRPS